MHTHTLWTATQTHPQRCTQRKTYPCQYLCTDSFMFFDSSLGLSSVVAHHLFIEDLLHVVQPGLTDGSLPNTHSTFHFEYCCSMFCVSYSIPFSTTVHCSVCHTEYLSALLFIVLCVILNTFQHYCSLFCVSY